MKNLISGLTVICLVFAVAGNAVADFHDSSLSFSIYNGETNIETGYDLGTIGVDIDLSLQNVKLWEGANVSDTDSHVALFSWTQETWTGYYGLCSETTDGVTNPVVYSNAVTSVWNFGYSNGASPVEVEANDPSGNTGFEAWGTNGWYAGFVRNPKPVNQPDLGDLDTVGFIDINLYHYDGVTLNRGFDPASEYAAIVRIDSVGDVTLNPEVGDNRPPTIDSAAASPNPAVEGNTVTLTGSAGDPDGDTLNYVWSVTQAYIVTGFPKTGEQVTFEAPAVEDTTDFTFTLSVFDGFHSAVTATVTVTVNPEGGGNSPPTIDSAAASPNPAIEGTAVTLSGSAEDPDGDTLIYEWSTTDNVIGFPKTGEQVTFEAPAVETTTHFTLTLNVSDGTADPVTATVTVTVNPEGGGNSPPTIDSAVASPNPAVEGTTVTLTGSATDPDGDTLTYEWSTTDNVTGFPKTGEQVTFEAPAVDAATEFAFTLSVSDGVNDPVTDTVTITINDSGGENTPPVADAGGSQFVQAGDTVTLDGSGSSDPDGQIVTYQWQQFVQNPIQVDIIDDDPADGLAAFQVPEDAPIFTAFTFTLTVTDNGGESDPASNQVFVVSADYTPPEADAGPDQTVWENEAVTLDGSASTTGDAITCQWSRISGPVDVELTDDTMPIASFTAPEITTASATFVFQLSVSDPTEFAALDTATVTVKKNLPPDAPPSSALTPVNDDGVWESSELTPSLLINNAPPDPDGDVLTYEFQIYTTNGALPENLIFGADGIPEGGNTTAWSSPVLDENTHYFWRARANDGFSNGPWMDLVEIFINAREENPGVPAISAPGDGTSVDDLKPTLEVTNATDPDEDPLTYEFRIYEDQAAPVYAFIRQETDVVEGTGGTTQWKVETDLTENQYYWWRVRAIDDTALAGDWTDAAMFLVDTTNDAPETPVVVYPEDESEIETLDPVFEIEGGIDPEGDLVDFFVELDTVDTFDSANLIQSGALAVTSELTTWSVPQSLDENTIYYYRVKASDGEAESAWSTGSFFVNQFNEPPGTPVNDAPTDEQINTTLTPTLRASTVCDPDNDTVTYAFELFLTGNLTDPVAMVNDLDSPEWEVPGTHITNGKKYHWHVRAVDEHGEAGEWSALTEFTIGANNFQPSTPERVSPFDGGTVNTLTPTFSVVATDDGDGFDIWIEFELYRDSDLSDLVSFSLVQRGATATSWQVDVTLADLTEYFWRARATDGEKYSAWTTVAGFSVDVSGDSTLRIRVWQVADYDPTVPWFTVVEVDDADSTIFGTRVILPPGALSTHETIYIGEARGVPSLGAELIPLGKVVEFGPSGTVFNVPVTIKIPYTDEDLEKAGGISPEDLRVYTYNETDQHWETIPVVEVDHQEQVLISEVNHFSLYSTATDAGSGSNDSNSGVTSGGGGGCFIGSAGSSFLAGAFGRAMATVLTISLIVFNGYRRK